MSDAMSSVEIEDVLSSIRRLVAQDLRPAPRPPMGVQTAPQNGLQSGLQSAPQIVSKIVMADKLILTPALRVVRSEPEGPPPRLHLGPAHMTLQPDVVTKLSQAVDSQALDWESETGETGPEADGLDWSSFTFARRSLAETWAAQVPADPDETVLAAEAAAEAVLDPAARVTVAEALIEPAGETLSDAGDEPTAEMLPDPAMTAYAPVVSQDSIAAEPSSDDVGWADVAEAEALADLAEPPVAEVISGPEQEEDNIFSEQVLRELVRDLIRAELQGDLGERITRNIRKLVHAEIARAMAVQALE